MPGPARQFEPHITRSGGAPSKFRFVIRCSECRKTDTYEASNATGDDIVKGYFKDRGWLLGRDRSYDLCSTCLARPRNAHQPRRSDLEVVGRQPDRSAMTDKRHQDTADILARHLGKPEALAAEVFRPKEVEPARSSAPEAPRQPVPVPALPPELEQALAGMAADLKGLRSAIELMAEQVSKLVALGGQQVEAIARLVPVQILPVEGDAGNVREAVSAVGSIPSSLPHQADLIGAAQQPTPPTEPVRDEPISSGPEALIEVEATERSRQGRRSKRNEKAPKMASAPVVVKSIADAKRSDRFYTSIRLPRALWDSAGFGPEDRLLLDWSGKTLTIDRAAEGGVKPKSIGDAAVILQSWKLGNLNFDHPKVTDQDASLRLTA